MAAQRIAVAATELEPIRLHFLPNGLTARCRIASLSRGLVAISRGLARLVEEPSNEFTRLAKHLAYSGDIMS